MKAQVCEYCAGENLNEIKILLENMGYQVEIIPCIGLCAKYGCERINVKVGEREISTSRLDEFIKVMKELK